MNNHTYNINPIEILLVEDNPADVRLTIETLKEEKVYNRINVVADGQEALDYLRKKGKYSAVTRPDLILLDLNLPKVDGREVLKEIKGDESLKAIPVVVLTTSRSEEDIVKSYNLHANCYITKPVDLEQFTKVARSIQEFWMTIVKLPSNGDK
jgi:chemotaxis family two-component system response regulator Rcp1